MKLTAEEIECINQTLINKGVKFDDLKLEVIDHIASEIENEMEATRKAFPEVYKEVFERWDGEFKLTRAFFSLSTYYPKLARSKFGNQIKLEIIGAIAISLLLLISFQLVSDSNAKLQFVFWVKKAFFYSYFATLLFSLFLKYFSFKPKVTSTYKHSFDLRFKTYFIFIALVFNDTIPHGETGQNIFILFSSFFLTYFLSTIYLGFKHYQFQKKFSIQ